MDPEPKNDVLWAFIARCAYSGIIVYVLLVTIVFLCDLFRKSPLYAKITGGTTTYSPLRWHSYFIERYRDTNVFYYVEIMRLVLNGAVCILYIIGTYRRDVPFYIAITYRVLVTFFIADILSISWEGDSALAGALSISVMSEAFSIPSLILAEGPDAYLNFTFLRSIQTFMAFDRLQRRMFVEVSSSKRLIGKLALQCLTLFYTLAAGIQLLEIPGDLLSVNFRENWSNFGDWDFFNSIYFVIVTLSTVGYGDFSPSTIQGRLYTLLMIIIGIVIFTSVIGELVEQSSRGRGSGWFIKSPETRHVIVTGTPTLSDLTFFVSEFYSNLRDANANAKIVILIESPSWTDNDWYSRIAHNQFLHTRLQYLVGSVRNSIDLQRARLNSADAVFFLNSPSTGEAPSEQDTSTVMNILAIRNTRTDVPIFTLNLLEESNLQTDIALRTPTTYDKGTYFRNTKIMRKGASYGGLFQEVLKNEYIDLPKVHKRGGKNSFKQVLEFHKERQEHDVTAEAASQCVDLERSQMLCLQEMHMALMSGNMRVNGLGTLLANMYLDVQVDKPAEEDPAWISEYHLGATCSLSYAIMPEYLDNVRIRDIALEFYYLGLVLVGTCNPKHTVIVPVLGTDAMLRWGDIGVFLTYHEPRFVVAALQLAAERLRSGNLRHALRLSTSREDMPLRRSESNRNMDDNIEKNTPSNGHGSLLGRQSSFRFRISQSDDFGAVDVTERNSGASDGDTSAAAQIQKELSGHVIVAIEGEMPTSNLALFLKGLWHQDNRRSIRKARKSKVVVVHPNASDIDRDRFTQYVGTSLFFVEGSPSSGEAWHKANLSTAKAVVTMADYTRARHLSDARAIFTLLTLEASTASDHDVFICSELVDEKSLEFLREPMHPRRRGAMLGERVLSPSVSAAPTPKHARVAKPGASVSPSATTGDLRAARHISFQELEQEMPIVDIGKSRTSGEHTQDQSSELPPNRRRPKSTGHTRSASGRLRNHSKNLKQSLNRLRSTDASQHKSSDGLGQNPQGGLMEKRNNVVSGEAVDPAETAGAARARRGSLFSRSRYASGELLVHSNAITLLAREYTESGFSRFYSNLVGTEEYSPGLKIRLVRIPKVMFLEERGAVKRNNQLLVPYCNVFRSLIRQGVTPIGIYRSGQAPALIPRKPRLQRGDALLDELEPYLDKYEDAASMSSLNGLVKSFRNLVKDIQPSSAQEARGRDEVTGGQAKDANYDDSFEEEIDDRTPANGRSSTSERRLGGLTHMKVKLSKKHTSDREAAQRSEGRETENDPTAHAAASPRKDDFFSRFLGNDEDSFEVPGESRHRERPVTQNLLPYVYTLPEPNTLCTERDGIYVMCDPCVDLSLKWTEELGNSSEDTDSGST